MLVKIKDMKQTAFLDLSRHTIYRQKSIELGD